MVFSAFLSFHFVQYLSLFFASLTCINWYLLQIPVGRFIVVQTSLKENRDIEIGVDIQKDQSTGKNFETPSFDQWESRIGSHDFFRPMGNQESVILLFDWLSGRWWFIGHYDNVSKIYCNKYWINFKNSNDPIRFQVQKKLLLSALHYILWKRLEK